MGSFLKLLSAGPAFFLSSWFLMLIIGASHRDIGVRPFDYTTSMIVTIALWLTLAPAIGAVTRKTRPTRTKKER